MAAETDRHLLFGLLALQNGLIQQAQLVAAFHAWTCDKTRSLADHLVALGHMNAPQRAAVEALAALHVEAHGGDATRSLAAVQAGRSTVESLKQVIDPDLEASLTHVGSTSNGEAGETVSYSVGSATSEGRRFRVLRPHARGGLGAVFVALDGELNREVALKEIQDRHADDPTSRARFVLEAEITGGLEHPGIVPVYGLGAYDGGRPFYAMRFIRGDSLKEAIDHFHQPGVGRKAASRDLELRRLLRRFLDVCNAVDYAHSRGVLHRDIKPGNVMVGRYGETLVVDWGLAKTVGKGDLFADSDERTLRPSASGGVVETLPGKAIGTPGYMSPEQAAGDLEKLGPRSDVYSLGATLYALLTGKAPFKGDRVEIIRAVQRGDFPPPRKLVPSIDPALEAVCLKAMALRPDDRYPTCRALAEDVERWTADEPVTAYRDPFGRRARRWAKRNRTAVTAAAVALVAGVVGLSALAAVQSRYNADLTKANGETTAALAETREAQKTTAAALAQSEESREQAEAVGAFLVGAFKKPDPSVDGKDVKVADVLDQALAELDKGFTGSKATEGALLTALGRSYAGLGLYPKAEEALRRARAVSEAALGPDHPDTLASRNNLAVAYQAAGRAAEAIALLESTLKLRESKLGADHPDTLVSRNNLANSYLVVGRAAEAVALHESTLRLRESKLGPDHPDTLASRSNLSFAYEALGRWADAEPLYRDNLSHSRTKEKPDSLLLAGDLVQLGRNLMKQSKWSEAEPLLRECLAIRVKSIPDDLRRFNAASLLGGALLGQGKYAEAEPLVVGGYEGTKAREVKNPAYGRHVLTEAEERVVRLYKAWGKPEQAAEWAAKLGLADLPADVFARP